MVAVLYDYRDILRLVPPVPRTPKSEKVLDLVLFAGGMFRDFFAANYDGGHGPTDTGGDRVLLWCLSVVAAQAKRLAI